VIHYRGFRNTDPPGLMEVWNDAFPQRGAVRLRTSSPLERHVFAKLYFDPAGLLIAEEAGQCVGFAHAGFGADPRAAALSAEAGTTCLLGVRATHRRRGIGTELLRRSEAYLRQRGAVKLHAGAMPPLNPFYLGVYGGSELPGILASDSLADPFLARNGYRVSRTVHVLQRRLTQALKVVDPRFATLRPRYDLGEDPRARLATWWSECVFGLVEPLEFYLADKSTGERVARALVWEMEGFNYRWGHPSVGLTDFAVRPELRRKGLGKFFASLLLRRIQEQYYEIVEVQVPEGDAPARGLLRGLGFEQVDTGRLFERPA
jgi:ribosomal protein S18 acetylase RimI-like enzyme